MKPRLCEILGVEVNEEFKMFGLQCKFWINEKGEVKSEFFDEKTASVWTLMAINDPDKIHHYCDCSLTDEEVSICKTVGAKYVSMDNVEGSMVHLWSAKPEEIQPGFFGGSKDESLGLLHKKIFPSLKPGYCVEANNGEW